MSGYSDPSFLGIGALSSDNPQTVMMYDEPDDDLDLGAMPQTSSSAMASYSHWHRRSSTSSHGAAASDPRRSSRTHSSGRRRSSASSAGASTSSGSSRQHSASYGGSTSSGSSRQHSASYGASTSSGSSRQHSASYGGSRSSRSSVPSLYSHPEVHHHPSFSYQPLIPEAEGPLFCELADHGCGERYHLSEQNQWMAHIANDHFQGHYPTMSLCWFCDDHTFDAREIPGDNGLQTLQRRLSHIYDHIFTEPLTLADKKPDHWIIRHLQHFGLLG